MRCVTLKVYNPSGSKRVIVTKELPGSLWLERLIQADCKVEVLTSTDTLSVDDIKAAIAFGIPEDSFLGASPVVEQYHGLGGFTFVGFNYFVVKIKISRFKKIQL